jgi:hypothetical protein
MVFSGALAEAPRWAQMKKSVMRQAPVARVMDTGRRGALEVNRDWLILLLLIALLLLGMLLTLWQGGGSRHGYNALAPSRGAATLAASELPAPEHRETPHLPG